MGGDLASDATSWADDPVVAGGGKVEAVGRRGGVAPLFGGQRQLLDEHVGTCHACSGRGSPDAGGPAVALREKGEDLGVFQVFQGGGEVHSTIHAIWHRQSVRRWPRALSPRRRRRLGLLGAAGWHHEEVDQPRRYRLRPGAVGFTRSQLIVVIIALVVAVAGLVALILRAWLIAGGVMGAAGVSIGFTTLLAHANSEPPPT